VDCFFRSSSIPAMASALPWRKPAGTLPTSMRRVYDGAHLAGHKFLPYRTPNTK
jgi:hypothetical protein